VNGAKALGLAGDVPSRDLEGDLSALSHLVVSLQVESWQGGKLVQESHVEPLHLKLGLECGPELYALQLKV
jgi:hypothetical protein